MSDNVNQSCSLDMLHPYSLNVIVAIVHTDFSNFIDLMTKQAVMLHWITL